MPVDCLKVCGIESTSDWPELKFKQSSERQRRLPPLKFGKIGDVESIGGYFAVRGWELLFRVRKSSAI